jgi:hypothetical protein
MIVDIKLLVQIQFIVDELQQAFKIACSHISSGDVAPLVSSQSIMSAFCSIAPSHLCRHNTYEIIPMSVQYCSSR